MHFPSDFVKNIYPRTLLLFERDIDWRITGRWTLYAALVGVVTALAALLFAKAVALLGSVLLINGAGYSMPFPGGEAPKAFIFHMSRALHPARPWLLPILPALGGLAAGWVVYRFAPEAQGHGTDAVINAFHQKK
ncbi:MAG TPA: chloride channel protein, partial [Rhodothermales bacterium]|nr:chloride channel protein [Rhodothermales bacterium]